MYLAKGEYDRVIEFLDKNEASFGMLIEKRKLKFKTLMRKGDKLGAVNELLTIIKSNYENVNGDFQSIYDHHEILISLIVDLAKSSGLTLTADTLTTLLSTSPTPEPLFPPLPDLTADSLLPLLRCLYASFSHYKDYQLD